MDIKQKPAKEKRRNNEKRKEKSRDAARCRRSRETEIFTDLSNALPLSQEQLAQLDKASVMRLAISYLRVRDMINLVPEVKSEKNDITADESVFLKSMDGFVLVISNEGDFIYLSENVSDYLGISQIDLMGQNIYEYSHPCDHDEIKDILSSRSQEKTDLPKSFFLRLKCTLTSKGRSVNLKSASYKVIHCTGHMLKNNEDPKKTKCNTQRCLVAIGQPIPHPSNIEAPLPRETFLTKHNLDMKITYADEKIMDFLGYKSEDLMGNSMYDYHHATDSNSIAASFKCLFSKGQCETSRYRFLAKTGGYVWVITQATLIYDKIQKPQSVVCVNYVVSGVECKDEIYAAFQLSSIKTENKPAPIIVSTTKIVNENLNITVPEEKRAASKPLIVTAKLFSQLDNNSVSNNHPRPQTATSTIFAPRTEDMNKGFLMYSEEEPGLTILKDEEPDDLTHLAPVASDMVPLETHPYLTDMLDDILLRDGFCPLLADAPADPFISYRNSCDPSPQLLSPNILKSSDCSLSSSLNSPTDSLPDEDHMSSFMNLQMDDDPELIMKAPYIPMNMGDDLPLLLSDDFMWNSSEKTKNSAADNSSSSSLAQLLSSRINKHGNKPIDHGGTILQTHILDAYPEKNWNLPNDINRDKGSENINKRASPSSYESTNKRTKCDIKDNMSSELLQQLMSNNHNRSRPKGKSNWLLDSGGRKAACISQPSDSVLMNLLDNPLEPEKGDPDGKLNKRLQMLINRSQDRLRQDTNADLLRKTSISLLNPERSEIPSLLDLTQQDYDVNAPVKSSLLQGEDLITALEINGGI